MSRSWSALSRWWLSIVLALVIGPWAAAQPPSLDQAVERLDAALAAGAAPGDVDEGLRWLLAAAEAEPGRAPELVRRLDAQLRPLGSNAPAGDAARRQELVRRAAATLDALIHKLERMGSPPAPRFVPLVAPANDACADAIALTDGFLEGATSGATNDGGASCGASDAAPDVWYSYTAAAAGVTLWGTFGSAMDTVLSLHSACPDAGGDHELACNDDTQGTTTSQVERLVAAGETVWVRVSGAAGASGSFRLSTNTRPPGSIGGTVTKVGVGAPIARAEVDLFDDDGFFFDFRRTADDGSYLFSGLPAGDWFLSASATSFQREIWEDRTCPTSFCSLEEVGDPVTVGTGLVAGIDFDLEPAGSIEGRVTDADTGDPLSIFIDVFDAEGQFIRSGGSDSAGVYRVTSLRPGTYIVATSLSLFAEHGDELYDGLPCEPTCDVTAGTPVTVSAGSTTPGIDFALDRLGTITGTVTSAVDGQPIVFESVNVFDQQGDFFRSDSTDGAGVYRLPLPTGSYFVGTSTFEWIDELFDDLPCHPSCVVTGGTPVGVALGVETAGIDFVLDRFGSIAGEVTVAEGGTLFDARVEVYAEDGSFFEAFFVGAGEYEVGRFVPGLYFVRMDADLFGGNLEDQLFAGLGCDPSCEVTAGTPVPVAISTVTGGIDFALRACPLVSHLELSNLFLLGSQTREACRTIAVGSNVTVAGTGELVLRAGESVALGDGFSVAAGGRLAVQIDPGVGTPP